MCWPCNAAQRVTGSGDATEDVTEVNFVGVERVITDGIETGLHSSATAGTFANFDSLLRVRVIVFIAVWG